MLGKPDNAGYIVAWLCDGFGMISGHFVYF